ncbi:hypothetical protein P879_11189 [Paragonimus westermani]|uniref:CUB domain-containing protein n=1 Tax=Paragonimus westermani TaxID=34504 RepID=A0A8T0D6G6_9TREM|nr:hypothetical protein P879_11189 [Paragonimus westermani]
MMKAMWKYATLLIVLGSLIIVNIVPTKQNQAKCVQVVQDGNITSAGYPHHPEPDKFCYWKIPADRGERIVLRFSDFQIGQSYILLVVEEYTCTSQVVALGNKGSGNAPRHRSVSFRSKEMSVLFITNDEGMGNGFHAEITRGKFGVHLQLKDLVILQTKVNKCRLQCFHIICRYPTLPGVRSTKTN